MPEIIVPNDWTPAQTTAVFEFVVKLKEAISVRYQVDISKYAHDEESKKKSGQLHL